MQSSSYFWIHAATTATRNESTRGCTSSATIRSERREKACGGAPGYVIKDIDDLVTIDRVWKADSDLPMSKENNSKDLCLSFALFKVLRCQFARYKIINAGSIDTISFFWNLLLQDGGHDRVFRVISDELSFARDYYYSSLPMTYSKCRLTVIGIFCF